MLYLENFYLNSEDFRNIENFLEREHISLTEYEMYNAGNYCILSAVQNSSTHQKIYKELIFSDFNTPDKIIEGFENSFDDIYKILKIANFPNQKMERIYNFAHWWKDSDLPKEVLYDAQNGREEEFNLRNQLAKEAPGLGLKCASLYMIKCGYENIVPVDIVFIKYLKKLGYDVEIPNYKTKSGPKHKEYLELEKVAMDLTKEEKLLELTDLQKISPAILQAVVWRKYSTYREDALEKFHG